MSQPCHEFTLNVISAKGTDYVYRRLARRPVRQTIDMDIGWAIDTLRREKGWTKSELAVRAGFNDPNLNRIISGKQEPTIKRLEALAQAFGIQVYEILRLAETRQGADARKALLHSLIDEMTPEQIDHAFRRSSQAAQRRAALHQQIAIRKRPDSVVYFPTPHNCYTVLVELVARSAIAHMLTQLPERATENR